MLDEKNLQILDQNLQRIFAMYIGRTTFREAQNAILAAAQGNKDDATQLFESLLNGEVKETKSSKGSPSQQLKGLIDRYSVALRLARDVYERGDFLQVITSDTVYQNDRPLFVNRIKRIDGKEYQFICDIQATLHLLNHFSSRLHEQEQGGETKGKNLLPYHKELTALKQKIEQLLNIR